MNKQNVGIILGSLMIFLVVGGISFLIWQMASRQADFAQKQPHDLAATPQNLKYLGLQLDPIPVSDPRAQGVISGSRAVTAALIEEPDLKMASRVTRTLGELHDLRLQEAARAGLPVDPKKADMGLVWIVTFEGIDTASAGPGQAPGYVAHEYNVVINAKTGAYIMSFPLADITPTPP